MLYAVSSYIAEAQLERRRAADAAQGFSLKTKELQQRLEQERAAKAAALLEQKEQYEQQRHSLQRLLADAEEQLERQRREMSAGFLLQAQQLDAKHAAAAADARAEAATAAALAEARAGEAAAAHAQAVKQMKRAEVGSLLYMYQAIGRLLNIKGGAWLVSILAQQQQQQQV